MKENQTGDKSKIEFDSKNIVREKPQDLFVNIKKPSKFKLFLKSAKIEITKHKIRYSSISLAVIFLISGIIFFLTHYRPLASPKDPATVWQERLSKINSKVDEIKASKDQDAINKASDYLKSEIQKTEDKVQKTELYQIFYRFWLDYGDVDNTISLIESINIEEFPPAQQVELYVILSKTYFEKKQISKSGDYNKKATKITCEHKLPGCIPNDENW